MAKSKITVEKITPETITRFSRETGLKEVTVKRYLSRVQKHLPEISITRGEDLVRYNKILNNAERKQEKTQKQIEKTMKEVRQAYTHYAEEEKAKRINELEMVVNQVKTALYPLGDSQTLFGLKKDELQDAYADLIVKIDAAYSYNPNVAEKWEGKLEDIQRAVEGLYGLYKKDDVMGGLARLSQVIFGFEIVDYGHIFRYEEEED